MEMSGDGTATTPFLKFGDKLEIWMFGLNGYSAFGAIDQIVCQQRDPCMLKLFDYTRSSAATRVRIALALKGIDYAKSEVHLARAGGDQNTPAYTGINPQGLVPALQTDAGILTQSLAIIAYIDACYPDPPLLPSDPWERAQVQAMALTVPTDIHPIQNLRVLNYLRERLGSSEDEVTGWARHWIVTGLVALQSLINRASPNSRYCYGETVTLADVCLAPQMVNARRYGCELSEVSRLLQIEGALRELSAFAQVLPPT